MELVAFSVCDRVEGEGDEMTLFNPFDVFYTDGVPVEPEIFFVAAFIRFGLSGSGPHRVTLRFIDADGQQLGGPFDDTITVRFNGNYDNIPTRLLKIVYRIERVRFPEFGDYSMELAVDGDSFASAPVYVRRVRSTPATH